MPPKHSSKNVTITDVARVAGVSKATVSHVINNTRYVSEETRQSVLRAIEALHFHPNHVARSLTVQRTYTAGLLISDVANPFYHRIILGMEEVALAHDYSVFLFNASYDQDRSIKYIRSMIERRVDGVILMSSRMSDTIVRAATDQGLPTVVLDWNEFRVRNAGSIAFDFERGIRQAVAHLRELGHERFAHVAGNLELWTARNRRDLFLQILAEQGVDSSKVPVIEGNFTIEGGRRAFHELFRGPNQPTAVLAVNDMTAIGLMLEAQHRGINVPDDFSVIGMDDIALGSETAPTLTTIALPCYEIGTVAMTMLLDLIGDSEQQQDVDAGKYHHVIDTNLIIRGSTAPPKNPSV